MRVVSAWQLQLRSNEFASDSYMVSPSLLLTEGIRGMVPFVKAFGHAVMEGAMAQSEQGRIPAERGVVNVVFIIVTLLTERFPLRRGLETVS